jgi:hypothetical protein
MLTLILIFQLLMGGGSDAIRPKPPGDRDWIVISTDNGPNPLGEANGGPKPPGDRDNQWVSTDNRDPLSEARGGWKPPWYVHPVGTGDGPWFW